MADEIKTFVRLTLNTTNNLSRSFVPPQMSITQTNPEAYENTLAVTTVDSTLSFATTSYGYGFFQNVSSSTAVVIRVGVDSTAVIRPFLRLGYGHWAVAPLVPTSTYRAQCESSSGRLYYGVWGS
jgi:hypothetical protein